MKIKHLVLTGGGPSGLLIYGAAKMLSKKNIWNIKEIETIYGCSIGSLMGFIFSLDYEWHILDDYFIKRPWSKVIKNNTNDIFELYSKSGLINDNIFLELIKPLLFGKNLELDITMNELFIKTNKELHFITSELYNGELNEIDISYKTHPELGLITALKMSMSFPILFQPIYNDNRCYIDGGLLNMFPLNNSINNIINNYKVDNNLDKEVEVDVEENSKILNEILAFRNRFKIEEDYNLDKDSNILNFASVLIKTIHNHLSHEDNEPHIKNTIYCELNERLSPNEWFEILDNNEMIVSLINAGEQNGKDFYEKIKESID
tara:strand:- start:8255 stop:9211 length:957 start_codon:yes stop_codon:yes gene_type:complete